MATSNAFQTTPTKTPSDRSTSSSNRKHQNHQISIISIDPQQTKSRFEAYNRLQAAAVALGEKLPIPEIIGTRRPFILQMVHDTSAQEPRCRFQEEDSEEYGSPIISSSTIADLIKSRTEALLKKTKAAVSSKPIAKKGEPENTPDEILSMVKSLASPPHRILLFLQQISVEWCSSLWLDAIHDIDPTFRRTVIVVSKFDNRLKEFSDGKWTTISVQVVILEITRPFFVALPKDWSIISNEEFRRKIPQGGFDEEKFEPYIGFGCLREFLEFELQKRYKEAAPATLAYLNNVALKFHLNWPKWIPKYRPLLMYPIFVSLQCCMQHPSAIMWCVALIDGAADPPPEQWGRTTEEEKSESGIGGWPGVTADVRPPNATLRLYGGAAFERVMHELHCAAYLIYLCFPTFSQTTQLFRTINCLHRRREEKLKVGEKLQIWMDMWVSMLL
ncbi:hypothetical protein RJ641_034406 [Dillenia turbinata]|uniref:Dynamin-type G domain-containing protein n=1 Tax=Dillenia turbinata TaxID=194707 RepID=A0AAN8VQL3_9MAGN